MSADNGIYILSTLKGTGFEHRVSHLQCIENLEWDTITSEYSDNPDVYIQNAREMFADCEVFSSYDEAWKAASDLYKEIMNDGLGIIEYGIQAISVDREF